MIAGRMAGGVRVGVGLLATAALGCAAFGATPASGQAFMTQEEALRLAFSPPAVIERRTAFLGEDEIAEANRRAGDAEVESGVVTYYVGRTDEGPIGYAYFDAHRVRTLDEVLMVVVDPGGAVAHVEVLQFREPREYLAPDRWLALFDGRRLDEDLSTKGDIVNLTGATLTSRAVAGAVRRVLALHEVVHGGSGAP